MDDNRLLTLPSNERIRLLPHMKVRGRWAMQHRLHPRPWPGWDHGSCRMRPGLHCHCCNMHTRLTTLLSWFLKQSHSENECMILV